MNNDFVFKEFYAHRIRRIFPALILVTGSCYTLGWFALMPAEFKQLGMHIAAGMGFVQNFVLWKEAGYFDVASELKPLMHLWSLAIEEQFYIIYPLLVWLLWKTKLNVLTGIFLFGIISFALNYQSVHQDAVKTFFAPHTRFWELMAGSILSYIHVFRAWRPSFTRWFHAGIFNWVFFRETPDEEDQGALLASTLSFCGLALVIYSITVYDRTMPYPGSHALAPVIGAILLILAGPQAWVNRKLLANKTLIWIGIISYPLYLWHWPLLSFARIVESGSPSRGVRMAAVAVSFILAALTYYLIEKPIRYGRPTWKKVTTLCVFAALVGYVGYNAYSRNGLAFRYPKIIESLSAYKYDYGTPYRLGACLLEPQQSYVDFNKCNIESMHSKSILIWGDSHAAHLYPGYKYKYSSEFSVIQRTASACPPILNFEAPLREHCKGINDNVFDYARSNPPDRIVLAASWTGYDLAKLEDTLKQLRSHGFNSIDFVGPVPQWYESLPKQLYLYFMKHIPHIIPNRMDFGLNKRFIELDLDLKKMAERNGVRYISTSDILCDNNGCLTRLPDEEQSLTAWDTAHLTVKASEYLVSHFPK